MAARPVNLATLATAAGAEAKTIVYQNAITIEAPAGGLTLSDGGLVALMSDSGVTVSGKLASALPAGSEIGRAHV